MLYKTIAPLEMASGGVIFSRNLHGGQMEPFQIAVYRIQNYKAHTYILNSSSFRSPTDFNHINQKVLKVKGQVIMPHHSHEVI